MSLFANPTHSTLEYWILKGEQSTWPYLACIKNRISIEIALKNAWKESKDRVEAGKVTGLRPTPNLNVKRKSIV